MPTVREILGSEFATLKAQGKSDEEIIAIAKQRKDNPPQEILAPQTPQMIPLDKQLESVPKWYKGESDSAIANFFGDVARGAGKTGLNYYNSAQAALGYDNSETTKLLQKLDYITEEHKKKGRTPERQKEVDKLNENYANAKTFSEKFSAGFDTLVDTLSTPSEWQVAEFVGENMDPINVIPGGKGFIAGATIGGVTNGVQAAAFAGAREDKSDLDVAVESALGVTAGVALGGPTGMLGKSFKKQTAQESNFEAANADLGIDPFNKIKPEVLEGEIVDHKVYDQFANLLQKQEAQIIDVDLEVKALAQELHSKGASAEQIETEIAKKLLPSPEAIKITEVLNDGAPVTPRMTGLNIQQAIINSINNPIKTADEFYASMKMHGFSDDVAAAATRSYETGEIGYFSSFAHDKLLANKEQLVDIDMAKREARDVIKESAIVHGHDDVVKKISAQEFDELQTHPRFNEVLDMTRTLNESDKRYPNRLEAPRTVTPLEDGYAHVSGAVYSKNYGHDFQLSAAKVKRIESGKATPEDIASLKADLEMMDNNPDYALPTEAELKEKYDTWVQNPDMIYDFIEFDELNKRFDPETYYEKIQMFGKIQEEDINYDTDFTRGLARDSSIRGAAESTDATTNEPQRRGNNGSSEQAYTTDAGSEYAKQSDSVSPDSTPSIPGERSDTTLHKQSEQAGTAQRTARGDESARSGRADADGVLAEQRADAQTGKQPEQTQNQSGDGYVEPSLEERIRLQRDAQHLEVIPNDPQNIHDTLPILLKAQREDIIKVEKRFYEDNGRGMLLTNGTGTGKTMNGVGLAKRFERMGKKDIVIAVPSEAKALDWIEDAKLVGLNIRKLRDTKDSGSGDIVVTTYENLRDNIALQERDIDLFIPDESHKLMSNKDGKSTANLEAFRALTNHYTHAKRRAREKFPDDADAALAYAMELNNKTKVMFLSASPFASHKTLRYADDYLFSFSKDKWADGEYRGYGVAGDEHLFFMNNFGYQFKHNRLQRPDAEVNVDLMERTFAEKMRESGAMSGRALEVDKDYQRAFVLVENDIGKAIDAGFEKLNDDKSFPALKLAMRSSYMDTISLMESIKATEAVGRIKKHLADSRKVVVYHNFVDAAPSHPFRFEKHIEDNVKRLTKDDPESSSKLRSKMLEEYEAFKKKYPELYNMDLGSLDSPTATISKAFGNKVVMFNGKVSKANKPKSIKRFNNGEVDIIMVNESGKEGISLHDKVGDKQRVLINLSLPVKPIDMIQVEGRTYRTGQKSDAIFEYLVLHTNFEKRQFGSSINERVATVENLAMGEQSRSLRSAIKNGYMDAEYIEPGALDGKGGKAYDARAEGDTAKGNPYEYAKTLYFGRKKGRQNNRGADFFATPDPLGFKMAQWADIRPNDRVLEPSAGQGAIGKWFPADSVNHFIEQSSDLFSDLSVAVAGKTVRMDFMDFDIINKYDSIVMNPPYGRASKVAIEHLQKAMKHTSMNGRIVLLAPYNMMEKASFRSMLEDKAYNGWVLNEEIKLPEVTFERAGTKAMTSVYIFDKTDSKDKLSISQRYTKDIQANNINEFFDEIESLEVERKAVPLPVDEVDAAVSAVVNGQVLEIKKHTHTKTGEEMTVVNLGNKLSKDEFKMFTGEVKKFGGYYNRYVKGYVFEDEAKAYRFKDAYDSGSVKLNAMFIPGADKIADFVSNYDNYVEKGYGYVSDFVRGVDDKGMPKGKPKSNMISWLRDNFVLGGSRADHFLEIMREYSDMKNSIADEALRFNQALKHLSKEDSQDLVRALGGDMPADALPVQMRGIYEKFRKLIDEQTEELVKAGALDEQYVKENYIKRYYFDHIDRDGGFVNMRGSEANTQKFARADLDLNERIELGQVEDASYVVAKTIAEQKDQLNRAKLFNRIAYEVASDEAIEGYIKVPDTKLGIINKWGALNGKFVPKQVWDDLRGAAKMYDELNGVERFVAGWMSTIQHVKTNMTVKNVGTHLYNVLSNTFIAYLDGHYTQLARVVRDKAYYKQLHDEAVNFGLDTMLDDFEPVDMIKESGDDNLLVTIFKNAYMTQDSKLGKAMRKAYEYEDAVFKIAAYAKRKEELQLEKFLEAHPELDGSASINRYSIHQRYIKDILSIPLSEDEMRAAFREVDEVYVNYSTPLPKGVKALDQSGLFPFMHYTWKATPIFAKQMLKHPVKVAMLHVLAGSYGISKIWGDQDERDKVTPEWMNDSFNMLGLDGYKEVNDGEYLNIGRAVPAMRFMNSSPISVFLGLDGGILANIFGISVLGMDNKGYSVDGGKYDDNAVKIAKRASALAEQAAPPLFPAVPLVVRPKRDSQGREIKDEKEVVAFGGRYFQKAYDALGGKKDKRDNPLEVTDVVKQAAGVKLQRVDKLSEAQSSVNSARRLYVREYNSAANPRERAEANKKFRKEIAAIKKQLGNKDALKLKVNKKVPGSSSKVFKKFVSTNRGMIKL
jgi:hypothetical protein